MPRLLITTTTACHVSGHRAESLVVEFKDMKEMGDAINRLQGFNDVAASRERSENAWGRWIDHRYTWVVL